MGEYEVLTVIFVEAESADAAVARVNRIFESTATGALDGWAVAPAQEVQEVHEGDD